MPIYAYKCDSCGFAKDVLQKMSEDALTQCPSCGTAEFKKQVTAAGFQLKGSGWYVTDFRGDKTAPATGVPPTTGSVGEGASSDSATPGAAASPAAAATPATSTTPAASSGPSTAAAAT